VSRLVQSYGEKHRTAANRLLASVRACLQAAWRLDKIPSNSAMKVRPFRENPPRQRTLSDEELQRVLKALAEWPDAHERAAFTLLIETGARLSEVLRARWADVDLEAAEWRIPSPKAGHPQLVPLAASTAAMLRRLPRLGALVIPGRSHADKPRYDLKRAWDAIREAAKVPDVHVHDLRRTFGLAVARAAGLHVASKMLRHSDIRITEAVYAPLGIEELRKAAEEQAAHVDVVLRMRPKRAS
jgi:integrase